MCDISFKQANNNKMFMFISGKNLTIADLLREKDLELKFGVTFWLIVEYFVMVELFPDSKKRKIQRINRNGDF